MPTDTLGRRLRALRAPDAAPDVRVLHDVAALTEPVALAEAGRALDRVPLRLLEAASAQPLSPLRVAVVPSFTTDNVAPMLRALLLPAGCAPELWTGPYDHVLLNLNDPASELCRFAPDVTLVLLHDAWFLPPNWDRTDPATLRAVFDERVRALRDALDRYCGHAQGTVLLHTVPLSPVEHRGVISFRGRAALGRAWRELNTSLLDLGDGDHHPSLYTADLESLLVDGTGPVRDGRLYQYAAMAWSLRTEAVYAAEATAFCLAHLGLGKKLLALDLDDTLWGGAVGDVGPENVQLGSVYPGNCYREVQRRAQALRRQGVVLTAVSKNERGVVDRMLRDHPDQILREEDFTLVAADWQRKDRHLLAQAAELDLSLGGFVFADNSAFECDLVRSTSPEVHVLHLSGDPSSYALKLLTEGRFEVLSTAADDRSRTERYQARASRRRHAATYDSVEDYLAELGTHVRVRAADDFVLPRVLQLAARTNQFNLTGGTPSPTVTPSPHHLVLSFDVSDRFGDEGLVGALWIDAGGDRWLIENFVMSCRVLSRGIERAVLHHVAELAAASGARHLDALFRDTRRNRPSARFYPDAGFLLADAPVGTDATGMVRYSLALDVPPQLSPAWISLEAEEAHPHV